MMISSVRNFTKSSLARRSMGTIHFEKFGAPVSVLKVNQSPAGGNPGADEVRVSIKAAGVSTHDIAVISGSSLHAVRPGVAGTSGFGVVTAVGNAASHAVNDTVFVVGSGVWGDSVNVKSSSAFKVPSLPAEQVASFAPAVSAWSILNNFVTLKAGDVVLQSHGASPLGQAVTEVGAALGLKVLSPSEADINDAKFSEKVKAAGAVKLAIVSKSGKHSRSIFKVMANSGTVVVTDGASETASATEGLDVPMSSAIFNDLRIVGFDLHTAAAHNSAAVGAAVTAVAGLVSQNKVAVKAAAFPWTEYGAAIDATQKTGAPSVLKF